MNCLMLCNHILYNAFVSLFLCVFRGGSVCVMDLLFSEFELVFIVIAFTIMCLFGLAAVYTYNTDHQGKHFIYPNTHKKMTKSKCHLKSIRASHRWLHSDRTEDNTTKEQLKEKKSCHQSQSRDTMNTFHRHTESLCWCSLDKRPGSPYAVNQQTNCVWRSLRLKIYFSSPSKHMRFLSAVSDWLECMTPVSN